MTRREVIRMPFLPMALLLLSAGIGPGELCAQTKPAAAAHAPAGMQKFVTEKASFVVYVPKGWKAAESSEEEALLLTAFDPGSRSEALMAIGTQPYLGDAVGATKAVLEKTGRRYPDLQIANSKTTRDKKRVVFDGSYTHPQKGKREFRSWLGVDGGIVTCTRVEAPVGRLEAEKPVLLTILANVRVMKGAFASGGGAPKVMPLTPYRLRDGSASFQMPQGWKCQDFGKGSFIASDPGDTSSFSVGSAEVLSPQLGVRVPGAVVAPYMPPNQAWRLLTEQTGLVSRLQFEKVIPRQDISQEMARGGYTAGPVTVEELIYTCDVKGRRCKGYTFGFSFGSRLGTNWTFRHMTVGAPADQFESMVPTFSAMTQSFRFNEQWMANYIAQGTQRLRQLQQQTASMVSRNAEDIRRMMQAAYDERQKSMDYIDYQRTNYIRGQQDWVSSMEGGTVYHTDSWGTKNTATGEYWEGQPYDYVHFKGKNPKYNEEMTPIDSRALWERHVRSQ
jgi:hypothetical protein